MKKNFQLIIFLSLFGSVSSIYPIKVLPHDITLGKDGNSITLEGNFIKTQIGDLGSLGDNSSSSGLQIQFDKSGAASFSDKSVSPDYFYPGSPFEGFSVEVKPFGGSITNYINTNRRHSEIGTGTLTDKSGVAFDGVIFDKRAIWGKSGTSGTSTPFDIEHDFMFNIQSSFILIKTSITALNDFEAIYFGRYADPDSGQQRGLGFNTKNTVDAANAVTSVATDDLFAITLRTNTETGVSVGISPQPWSSSGKFYYEEDSTETESDASIGIGFKFDNVSSGDILSFYYAYCFGEDVTASRNVCSLSAFNSVASTSEWLQPYAAMQNLGLASMKNHRDLVLAKAGECNNYGWQVGDTDYCVYTNAKNTISYVNSSSTKGGYDTAAFNTAINIEKTINDKWKAGISYGYGSANLDNFNFSDTRANFNSYNSHYYLYGVKKASDKFTLKATFGGSDFDYYGYRNYGTYSFANSYYDADSFSGEINGIWNYKKYLNNSNNPIRLRPTAGIAYAIHNQDELSETGTGDLISIDKNQSESLLLKTGITVDRQIPMEKGKWTLIPSFGVDLEYDPAADGENTKGVKGKLTNSTTAATHVNAKNFGVVNAVAKLGADIVCTKDLMFSLNATIGVTNKGDQRSYGGGFRWQF